MNIGIDVEQDPGRVDDGLFRYVNVIKGGPVIQWNNFSEDTSVAESHSFNIMF